MFVCWCTQHISALSQKKPPSIHTICSTFIASVFFSVNVLSESRSLSLSLSLSHCFGLIFFLFFFSPITLIFFVLCLLFFPPTVLCFFSHLNAHTLLLIQRRAFIIDHTHTHTNTQTHKHT